MESLKRPLLAMVLATIFASLLCGLAAAVTGHFGEVWLCLLAAAVSLPVGVAVVLYLYRRGLQVESILGATVLRLALTGVLAGLLLASVVSSRSPVFLLSLAVVYLVNLGVETWCVLGQDRQSRECGKSV